MPAEEMSSSKSKKRGSEQGRKPTKQSAKEVVSGKEADVSASYQEHQLEEAEACAREQTVVVKGGTELESQPTAKRVRLVETSETIDPRLPFRGSESPDITPEEESIMLQALLDYEKQEEVKEKEAKKRENI